MRKIIVIIDGYKVTYEPGEDGWMVFGRDEDVYTLKSDTDICRDLAERMQNVIANNSAVNS